MNQKMLWIIQDYILCRTLPLCLSHIPELPLRLLFMRLIICAYSYLAFLFYQLYTQECPARVHNVPCYSSEWRGFQICCCSVCHWPHESCALYHLWNRKLKDGLSSTIAIAVTWQIWSLRQALDLMSTQFRYAGSSVLVYISWGVLPLFFCYCFMCSLEMLKSEWGRLTEHLETLFHNFWCL